MKFYDFGRVVCNFLLSIYFKLEISGYENLPNEDEGFIMISNHQSYLDPVLMGLRLKKRHLIFMAKDELFHIPILSAVIKKLGAFPVKRGSESKKAIEMAKKVVDDNKILALFPEGHRSKDGKLLRPKSGVMLIAAQTHAKIVPVCIYFKGKYPRARVKVDYGVPFDTEQLSLPYNPSKKTIKETTSVVWREVEKIYDDQRR